jgi:hypothetical protein
MQISSYIIDGFYSNVDEVRDFALSLDYPTNGNYPGRRSQSFLNESMKEAIESVVSPFHGKVTYWSEEQYTGCYQFTTSRDRSWIHSDQTTKWAGVCYLTPDAPVTAGTGIFRHKETGWMHFDYKRQNDPEYIKQAPPGDECQDYTKWEMVDRVGNVFNRLIMYRADNYHVSLDYFGKDLNDGRLFQVFFFNTER